MPTDFAPSDDEEGSGASAARRAWQRIKYFRRKAAAEKAAAAAREERARVDRAKDAVRGPPPAAMGGFRLANELVPSLLSLWDFAQTFGDVLGIPPCTLTGLEAALEPGPYLPADIGDMKGNANAASPVGATGTRSGEEDKKEASKNGEARPEKEPEEDKTVVNKEENKPPQPSKPKRAVVRKLPKVAPQNVITNPTIRTRHQAQVGSVCRGCILDILL